MLFLGKGIVYIRGGKGIIQVFFFFLVMTRIFIFFICKVDRRRRRFVEQSPCHRLSPARFIHPLLSLFLLLPHSPLFANAKVQRFVDEATLEAPRAFVSAVFSSNRRISEAQKRRS